MLREASPAAVAYAAASSAVVIEGEADETDEEEPEEHTSREQHEQQQHSAAVHRQIPSITPLEIRARDADTRNPSNSRLTTAWRRVACDADAARRRVRRPLARAVDDLERELQDNAFGSVQRCGHVIRRVSDDTYLLQAKIRQLTDALERVFPVTEEEERRTVNSQHGYEKS